jgi:hypothetical protein
VCVCVCVSVCVCVYAGVDVSVCTLYMTLYPISNYETQIYVYISWIPHAHAFVFAI